MPPSKNRSSRPSNSARARAPQSRSSAPRAGKPTGSKAAAKKAIPTIETATRGKNSPRKILVILGVAGGGVLLALIIMVGFLDGYGQKDRAQKSDAIVVLGARVRPDGKAGQGLTLRVLHAVRLYKKGFAPKIIMTGGVGDNPPSEAQVAAELAVKNGVPREDVIQENKSTSTWENAAYTALICKKRNWKTVLVVSDPVSFVARSKKLPTLWNARLGFAGCRRAMAITARATLVLDDARSGFSRARLVSAPGLKLFYTLAAQSAAIH